MAFLFDQKLLHLPAPCQRSALLVLEHGEELVTEGALSPLGVLLCTPLGEVLGMGFRLDRTDVNRRVRSQQ